MTKKLNDNDIRWCFNMVNTIANQACLWHEREYMRTAHTTRRKAEALQKLCSGFADITLVQQNPKPWTEADDPNEAQTWEIHVKVKDPNEVE